MELLITDNAINNLTGAIGTFFNVKNLGGNVDEKDIAQALEPFYTAIASFVMAFFKAIFRTAKKHGQVDWLEAVMCGFFAVGAWSLMTWLNIPEIVSVGLASAIGYKGTHFVSKKIDTVGKK